MRLNLKKISAMVYPHYSRYVDTLNRNALMAGWFKEHAPIRTFEISRDLYLHLNSEVLRNEPIDFLEFGVYQGGSLKYWTEINTNPESRFVGFDSFEGLPENWNLAFRTLKKGHFSTDGLLPGINDPRISYVKGWFQKSLDGFLAEYRPKGRLLIHIDCDLYTSSMYCLTRLDSILSEGSILLFDDFSGPLDIFRSFQDYVDSYCKKYRVIAARGPYFKELAVEVLGSRL
jgi:O-methyltransferase